MTTYDEIIAKHAQAARAEIEAEAARTTQQRQQEQEIATLTAKMGTLSQQLQTPNAVRPGQSFKQVQDEINATTKRLQELGAIPADGQRPAQRRMIAVPGKGMVYSDDPA